MIVRLPDASRLGPALRVLRNRREISRRTVATVVAEATGQQRDTLEGLLWRWESGRTQRPDLFTLGAVLQALGYDLALIPRKDTP